MDLPYEARLAILGILVLTSAVVAPLWIGYYILHPIDVLMRKSPRRLQFSLVKDQPQYDHRRHDT